MGAAQGAGLPRGQPDIRSHPERKPGGRAPPKEACQVSETIKRQGKHPGSEEEGEAWGRGQEARALRGGGAGSARRVRRRCKICGPLTPLTCVKWPKTLRKSEKHHLFEEFTGLENADR